MPTWNKLVRDRIPEIIEATGAVPVVRLLNDDEFFIALKAKLFEETQELIAAETTTDIAVEAADIVEVIAAICACKQITMNTLSEVRERKAASNGRFDARLFLVETRDGGSV
jgi:predicted house-cleaning noncanonical NTP pyrophosphatase (MazG superfamily)